MDFARYSIKTPINIWLIVVLAVFGGLLAFDKMGRLEDPEFTIKVVKVITYYPGADALTVEEEVTEVLEIAIQQMKQLDEITSVSKPGVSEITVEMKGIYKSKELTQIWDELRKKLRDAGHKLPVGLSPVVIDDFGDVFGLYYALSAPDLSPKMLRDYSRYIRRELLTVPGVAKVDMAGLIDEQIVAYINPDRLSSLGISFPDLMQVIKQNLDPIDTARMNIDGRNIRILVENSNNKVEQISNIPLVIPGTNTSIKIKDIASLSLEPVDIQTDLVRYNGHPAVTVAVSALSGVNIIDVGEQVQNKIEDLFNKLPTGVDIHKIYNQADMVESSVQGFIINLIMSVLVVSFTLAIFMGWRSAVVVGSILFITVMGTVLVMWLSSIQLQRISLGAMVIVMGMLVDNAIVIAEGMMLRMKQGKSAIEAASFIVKRTQWPLLGATIIGIAAFSGIGLSSDKVGEFLFSLFAVAGISLLLSWIFAVTVTPLFGSYFYQVGNQDKPENSKPNILIRLYIGLLNITLHHRKLTILLLVLITAISYASFGLIKKGFFPPSNSSVFYVHYWGPQDRDIRATEHYMKLAEQQILGDERVDSVTSFIGHAANRFMLTYQPKMPNENYGLFLIRTGSLEETNMLSKEIVSQIEGVDPSSDFYVERLQIGPSVGAKIAIRFSGKDTEQLRELANTALGILEKDPYLQDIRHDWREQGMVLNTNFDELVAGTSGISRTDFNNSVKYASSGLVLGSLREGDYRYPIVAKLAMGSEVSQTEQLHRAEVWSTVKRDYVPFDQLSKGITLESEELKIHRRNRVRTITVYAEPGLDENAATARNRIWTSIEAMSIPDGYYMEWGGEYESSRDAQMSLAVELPSGFLVMFVLTVLLFGSIKEPLIIWIVIPMAIVGVVAGLLVADMPFGFMSLLGFLSLFGMMIKNSIVLLEEIELQIEDGKPPSEAVVDASTSRLRPVSLAAITTILGMLPLLFDPFFADMSVTIMGGLLFATILTLIAVPALYCLLHKVSFEKTEIKL